VLTFMRLTNQLANFREFLGLAILDSLVSIVSIIMNLHRDEIIQHEFCISAEIIFPVIC